MPDRIDTDAVLNKTMLANLPSMTEPVDLEGDLYRTTVDQQRAQRAPLHLLAEGAIAVGEHFLDHEVCAWARAVGHLGSAAIAAGKATLEKALETIHEGDEQNLAIKREYGVGACLALCASVLPKEFAATVSQQFFVRGELSPGAAKVYAAILARPDAASVREGIIDNCRDGQRYVLERHITTEADLAVALKQNPELAKRYEHDIAFKLGTDSVIWASAHDKLSALGPSLPAAPAATSLEVRG